MNRARQPRSVVIAFAVLLGFGGCGSNRAPEFSVRRSSEAIQSLTTDLIGTPLSDDASLTRALDKIARSVLDLRTSSTEEYRSRHGRGP